MFLQHVFHYVPINTQCSRNMETVSSANKTKHLHNKSEITCSRVAGSPGDNTRNACFLFS